MFERVRQMLIKELILVLRDPRMRAVTFIIPCIQMLVIGYAVTTDVKQVSTAVQDLDNTPASRELVHRFLSSDYFRLTARVVDDSQAQRLVDRGDVTLVLSIHSGFSEDLHAGRTAQFQLILDGTDSNTAGIVLGYANRIVRDYSTQLQQVRFQRQLGAVRQTPQVELQTRAWFNENLESRWFYVPGVIVIVVSLVTLLLTSMAVVREKEIGTIEQIMVTPMTSLEFVLGKTVPFALIGFMDVILVTLVGVFWFGVPIRGSLWLLLFSTGLYLLTALGIGLLISTISRTQQQAMMSSFFFFFPAMMLSGFVFPIENMPQVVQWLTYLNPMRYFLIVIRGIFLKGIGMNILWPELAALAVIGVVTLWLVSTRFHKTLA